MLRAGSRAKGAVGALLLAALVAASGCGDARETVAIESLSYYIMYPRQRSVGPKIEFDPYAIVWGKVKIADGAAAVLDDAAVLPAALELDGRSFAVKEPRSTAENGYYYFTFDLADQTAFPRLPREFMTGNLIRAPVDERKLKKANVVLRYSDETGEHELVGRGHIEQDTIPFYRKEYTIIPKERTGGE